MIARLAWWYLRRRGLVTQLNTPDAFRPAYESNGRRYLPGWSPYFSIRYGRVPVYRCDLEPSRSLPKIESVA